MKDLSVTAIQSNLVWEHPEANRAHFDEHLSTLINRTDVIVLCEMFTTGFSMAPERIAEAFDDENMSTLNWMRAWAKKLDAVVTGSISVSDGGKNFNRLMWVKPDGSFTTYDKRHTFNFASEGDHYERGDKLLIEEWRGWKICPLICYDLRFPVWSRNRLVDGHASYDLLIYCANWPEARIGVWKKLLPARAIENQSYVVGVNRVGSDGSGLIYPGSSLIIDAKGETLHDLGSGEAVITHSINGPELEEFRRKFPVMQDADQFEIR